MIWGCKSNGTGERKILILYSLVIILYSCRDHTNKRNNDLYKHFHLAMARFFCITKNSEQTIVNKR